MSNVLGIASGIVSAGSAIYGAIRNKKAAKEQQQRQKELQEHAREQQMKTWKETNYPEQKKQLQEAGLNAGLLYGMGGSAGGETGSVGAGQAQQENVYDIGGAISNAAMAAQIEATKAQTAKTKAETEKIEGVDTSKAEAETRLTDISTKFKELETELAGKTIQAKANIYAEQANQMTWEAVKSSTEAGVATETAEHRVKQIQQEAIGAMLQNQLTEQQITTMIEQIEQRWEDLRLQGRSIEQSKENTEKIAEAMLWGAGIHAAGSIVNNVIDVATMPKRITKSITNKNEWDVEKGSWKKTITETTHK